MFILRLLKEKKKLLAKIDVLTRKVQSLQKKLQDQPSAPEPTHAESSVPKPSSPNPMLERPIPSTSKTALATHTSTSKAASSSGSATHVPHMSEPSSSRASPSPLDKPASSTSALRARTPEHPAEKPSSAAPIAQTSEDLPSTSKKRRLPDDFDQLVVPAQTFTAESLPTSGVENHAPRIRRNTHGLQAGFTPVRHTTGRSTTKPASPTRRPLASAAPAPPHPNVAAQSGSTAEAGPKKRTWLGKIRGAAAPPTTNSKP
jgi:hypothetical protein